MSLELRSVILGYHNAMVIRDISFVLKPAGVMALLGANGAGKSTLAKGVAGLLRPRSGSIILDGEDITHSTAAVRVKRGLSLVPEGRALFPSLTVRDNLRLGSYVRNRRASLDETLDILPALKLHLKQQAGTLSGGEQQMLAIGRAIIGHPKYLVLDEPSLGLSPAMASTIFNVISTLAYSDVGVLLIEQNVRAALDIATYGLVLERGEMALEGAAEELIKDAGVVRAYLGDSG